MKGGTLCALAYLEGDMHRFEKNWRKEYGGELYRGAGTALRYYSNLGLLSWSQTVLREKLSRLRLEK
jgi:hypothetical protein